MQKTTEARQGFVSNRGVRLRYLESGPAAGLPLLFLHGIRGFAEQWDPNVAALNDQYRCIAMDLRGRGESDWPKDGAYDFPNAYVEDIEVLVGELELERFVLVGHSYGGRIAIAYNGKHPEQVRAMVIVDISPALTVEGTFALKQNMVNVREDFSSWDEVLETLRNARSQDPPEAIAKRARNAFREGPDGKPQWKADPAIHREWRGDQLPPRALDSSNWDNMVHVQCPLLVCKGERTPYLTKGIAAAMANFGKPGRWVEVPGSGHFIMDDNPEFMNAELRRFLASVS